MKKLSPQTRNTLILIVILLVLICGGLVVQMIFSDREDGSETAEEAETYEETAEEAETHAEEETVPAAAESTYTETQAAEEAEGTPGEDDEEETRAAENSAEEASEPGLYAVVEVYGREYTRLPLWVDTELTVNDEAGNYNTIQVKDGAVSGTEANCANQICVYTAALDEPDELSMIICAPHSLLIYVEEVS